MTDSVPEKLGKYSIMEEVGRGGFAAVYKAVDITLDRTVALKVLAPHLLWDPNFVRRFQREAKVAANLDHSNIVTIYEVGQIEGVYFIAMQFLEGWTLSQVLEAEGLLPASRAQAIIEQMASALDYAHARGFVHRDIKPSNIMVADDGRATLTDFGLVKAGEGTKLSTTGVVFGTPEYMSPEQAEGRVLDARSDIYSLGVVLYEMLAGRAPFVADTTPAVMYKHVHEPPPLDELPSDLPQGVVAVVEKALAKKPEERYQSAGEMAATFQQAVSEVVVEEVKAPPEPVLHPSLTLQLLVKPQKVDVGGEAKWTVILHNDGDDDLRHVTVRRGRTLLDEPFDLAAGKGRRFTFAATYKAEGEKTEKVTATGIASTGESVRDEARATVEVTPIPLEPEKPAPAPVPPPAAVTPLPRPKRAKFLSLLMIAIGWGIVWAIPPFGGPGLDRVEVAYLWVISGAIGGFVTGLALRWTGPFIQWKQIFMIAIGWAIGWAIGSAIFWGANALIGLSMAWAIGGLITGLALWWAGLSISWKRVLIGAIGWAIGGSIGLGLLIGIVIIGDVTGEEVIGRAIGGAISGAIGGRVMLWQLSRARRRA